MLSDAIVQAITDLWKNANHKIRYDKPVLPVVLDAQGNPQLLTEAMLGGGVGGDASAANQVLQITQETATNTVLGLKADALATDSSSSWSALALLKGLWAQVNALRTNIVLATGTSVIGKVSVDQTTDGTTNLVVTKNRITTVSNGSGTITTGGTAQTAIASDAAGYNYLIQNNSSGDLWFSTLAAAIVGQPSIKLPPDAVYETPDSLKAVGALSVIGATTGQAFTVRKW